MDLADPADYRAFLSMQLMARAPVEAWLSHHLPDAPPPLADLIEHDLIALGAPLPQRLTFSLPVEADPIGACWAIAGSSMGNRAMLHYLTKSGKAADLPTAFLSDGTMTGYWHTLKPRLESPAGIGENDTRDAVLAAEAVFALFIAAAEACLPYRAAA